MTPDIWHNKWWQKFASLSAKFPLLRALSEDFGSQLSDQELMAQKCRQLLPYIRVCEREARELGFRLPELQKLKENPRLTAHAYCVLVGNRVAVNECVEFWRMAKSNKLGGGDVRWSEYPLRLRRKINEILETVRVEEEGGYWIVDDQAKELNLMMCDAYEKQAKGEDGFGSNPKKYQAAGHQ